MLSQAGIDNLSKAFEISCRNEIDSYDGQCPFTTKNCQKERTDNNCWRCLCEFYLDAAEINYKAGRKEISFYLIEEE